MSYTLVVVDVQKEFLHKCSMSVKRNISACVKQAVKDNAGIVFLEFTDCGKTIYSLRRKVSKYKNAYFIEKSVEDGSDEVHWSINENKFPPTKIKVVGAYTDHCVKQTVFGLSKMFPTSNIEVIKRACHNYYDCAQMSFDDMNKLKNVKVLL